MVRPDLKQPPDRRRVKQVEYLRVAMPKNCVVKVFLVKFDLKFEISCEISGEIWGQDFSTCKHQKNSGRISRRISAKFSQTSFQISRLLLETSFSRRAVLIQYGKLAF